MNLNVLESAQVVQSNLFPEGVIFKSDFMWGRKKPEKPVNKGRRAFIRWTLASIGAGFMGGSYIAFKKASLDAFLYDVKSKKLADSYREQKSFKDTYFHFFWMTHFRGKTLTFDPHEIKAFADVLDIAKREYPLFGTPEKLLDVIQDFPVGSTAWPINDEIATTRRIQWLESLAKKAEKKIHWALRLKR